MIFFPRLPEHERAQRFDAALDELRLRDAALTVGHDGIVRNALQRRRHDDEGQHQRNADQNDVGRQRLGADLAERTSPSTTTMRKNAVVITSSSGAMARIVRLPRTSSGKAA